MPKSFSKQKPKILSPKPGDLFTASTSQTDLYSVVLILHLGDSDVLVAPISSCVRYAADWDIILGENCLGYPAVAEMWNLRFILLEQLKERLGTITDPDMFVNLYDRMLSGGEPPGPMPQGPPILSKSDPRNSHRALRSDAANKMLMLSY